MYLKALRASGGMFVEYMMVLDEGKRTAAEFLANLADGPTIGEHSRRINQGKVGSSRTARIHQPSRVSQEILREIETESNGLRWQHRRPWSY